MSGKSVFISQSNYIPWHGYFDAINTVDEFIVYDDVQYTKRDWRNRNRIKTPAGEMWLTIPIEVKNKFHQKIKEAKVCDSNWCHKHWKAIQTNYSKSPYFKLYAPYFKELYLDKKYVFLTEVNYRFLKLICELLEIKTKITYSLESPLVGVNKTERLLNICKEVGATDYFSGPAAKNYLDTMLFSTKNINVHYFDFSDYEPYPQLYGDFRNELSVLDLLFNEGPQAKNYLRSNQLSLKAEAAFELNYH